MDFLLMPLRAILAVPTLASNLRLLWLATGASRLQGEERARAVRRTGLTALVGTGLLILLTLVDAA